MNVLMALVGAVILAATPPAADEPPATASAAATEAKWAALKPPAIVLLKTIDYSVNSDLTYRIRERRLIKILNKGGHHFSEVIVFYNTLSETLEIEDAKTIKPDGETVALDPANVHDVKSTGSRLYTESRYKRFSMPSVEDGCLIDYTFVKTGRNVHLSREFWKTLLIEAEIPQAEVTIKLSVPLTKRVATKLTPEKPGFEVTHSEDEQEYGRTIAFTFRDVPPLGPEPHAPAPAALGTRLIMTSIPSWETVWAWYRALADEARVPDEAITQAVAAATEGARTDVAKARAIYNDVCSNVRTVGLQLGPHGYQPHSAASVYENRYGDCKDKAILLLTMLDVAGLEGSIALVPTDAMAQVDTAMPTLDQFNHAIATLVIDGTRYWLDTTGGETAFGDVPVRDQGRTAFVIGKERGEFMGIPIQPADENTLKNTGTAALAADGTLTMTERIEYTGAFATVFRHEYRYEDAAVQRRELAEALNNFCAGAVLGEYAIAGMDDLADTVVYTRAYTAPGYAALADDLMVLTAPLQRIGLLELTALAERRQPLRVGQKMRRAGELTLAVPKEYRVRNLPKPVTLKMKVGTYTESYRVNDDGAIVCRNCFELPVAEIGPKAYPDFRNFVRRVAKEQRRLIVLVKPSSVEEP